MLRRLRIKFVLVIMSVVTVLFAVMFGLAIHLTKQNLERESLQMMRTQMFRPPDDMRYRRTDEPRGEKPDNKHENKPDKKPDEMPDEMPGNVRLPYFTVSEEADGTLKSVNGDYYGFSGQDALAALVDAAEASKEQTGVLSQYALRFMKSDQRNMRYIVFADISSEKAMLRVMIRNAVCIGLLGYTVLLGISIMLAKWVTKPVEKTWNEQKQFIADASHELKTPITVIMTNAEMLTDQSYPESDRAQFSRNILSTSRRMRGLVESLLELARLDNNRAPRAFGSVDYSKLINDGILPFEPLFYENDLSLIAEIEPQITVTGDKEKLRQVLTILLDNALKYCTPEAPVTVRLKRQPSGCLLSVSGAGTPLSKEDCQKIFQRFYRVDPARNDGQSYGLGLSIAQSIIREHNGKIWVESENSRNIFYVSLPE